MGNNIIIIIIYSNTDTTYREGTSPLSFWGCRGFLHARRVLRPAPLGSLCAFHYETGPHEGVHPGLELTL